MNIYRPTPQEVIDYFVKQPQWKLVTELAAPYLAFEAKDCIFTVDLRPAYCDRGALLVHLDVKRGTDPRDIYVDGADMWPRMYFHPDSAWREMLTWMKVRGQMPLIKPA